MHLHDTLNYIFIEHSNFILASSTHAVVLNFARSCKNRRLSSCIGNTGALMTGGEQFIGYAYMYISHVSEVSDLR